MRLPRLIGWMFPMGLMGLAGAVASGQTDPSRPVRIVTSEIGGFNDLTARMIAQGLSGSLGQQVIVDNRGIIAIDIVAKAIPDGHTLLCYSNNFWLLPFLQDNFRYDPMKDFSAITLASTAPNILVVHPALAAGSVKELIALAKAKPGELNYGSGATGGAPHLSAELFKAMAGVDIVRINYKGSASTLNALIGGQVQLMFATPGSVDPQVKAGRLKALAVTSARPSALAPGLPTMAASGLPGYEASAILGIFAPARIPAPVVDRLNQEIVRVLKTPEVRQRFLNAGSEVVGSSAQELTAMMKSEMAKWGNVIKDAGIHD